MNHNHFSRITLEVTGLATRLEAHQPGCLDTVDQALTALRSLFRQDAITRLELMQAARHTARMGMRALVLRPHDVLEQVAATATYQAVKGLSEWLIERGQVKPIRWTREPSYQTRVRGAKVAAKADPDPVVRTLELRGLGTQVIRQSDFYPWNDCLQMSQPDPRLMQAQRELAGYYTVPEVIETGETSHFGASSRGNGWGWVYHRDRPEYPLARVRVWGKGDDFPLLGWCGHPLDFANGFRNKRVPFGTHGQIYYGNGR